LFAPVPGLEVPEGVLEGLHHLFVLKRYRPFKLQKLEAEKKTIGRLFSSKYYMA
jgi:hypothetical protein